MRNMIFIEIAKNFHSSKQITQLTDFYITRWVIVSHCFKKCVVCNIIYLIFKKKKKTQFNTSKCYFLYFNIPFHNLLYITSLIFHIITYNIHLFIHFYQFRWLHYKMRGGEAAFIKTRPQTDKSHVFKKHGLKKKHEAAFYMFFQVQHLQRNMLFVVVWSAKVEFWEFKHS